MKCKHCGEPLVFIQESKTNGLIGKWICINEKCSVKDAMPTERG